MRLRHLEIFHAVMRSGSVSGAAELLNLSQSAASKALAQAEHALGLTLFKRTQGRLVHTREAEQLFAQTTLLFAQADSVQRLARNLKRKPEDHLRIGCLQSFGLGLIPGVLKAFRERCPAVSIEVNTGNGDGLVEQVLAQELDIALCFDMPLRQGLERVALGDIQVVHLGHGDAGPVRLTDLDPARWIGIGGSDPMAQRIRETCEQLGMAEVQPMVETRTYYVAAALARQGIGFALVDELTARAIAHGMPVRPLEPGIAVGAIAVHAATGRHSVAFDAFIATLHAQFRQPGLFQNE
jgi:DNA-binding transcriptional LysR family regulator